MKLPQPLKQLWEYSKRVFFQWKKVYALINFALWAITTLSFSGVKIVLPTWGWVLIVIVTLYLGTFLVYREISEKLPHLTVNYQRVSFSPVRWGEEGIPYGLKIKIDLDFRNSGQEKAKLSELNVTRCDLGTDLLEDKRSEIKLINREGKTIRMPCDIPGRDWASTKCELPVKLLEKDSKEFAKLVKKLQNFEIELQYKYEDANGRSYSNSIMITESFEAFRKQAIRNWLEKNQSELLSIMCDIPLR